MDFIVATLERYIECWWMWNEEQKREKKMKLFPDKTHKLQQEVAQLYEIMKKERIP